MRLWPRLGQGAAGAGARALAQPPALPHELTHPRRRRVLLLPPIPMGG